MFAPVFLLMMVVSLVRNVLALRSEKALKKLYIRENDERKIKIITSARASGFQSFITLGIAAFIIAGNYSMTVGLTILGCLLANSLLTAGFKLYYGKKY